MGEMSCSSPMASGSLSLAEGVDNATWVSKRYTGGAGIVSVNLHARLTEIGTIGASSPSRPRMPSRRSAMMAPIGSPTEKNLLELMRLGKMATTDACESGMVVEPTPSEGCPKAQRRSPRTSVTVPPAAKVTSPSTMTAATIEPGTTWPPTPASSRPLPDAATQPMRRQLSANQPLAGGAPVKVVDISSINTNPNPWGAGDRSWMMERISWGP